MAEREFRIIERVEYVVKATDPQAAITKHLQASPAERDATCDGMTEREILDEATHEPVEFDEHAVAVRG